MWLTNTKIKRLRVKALMRYYYDFCLGTGESGDVLPNPNYHSKHFKSVRLRCHAQYGYVIGTWQKLSTVTRNVVYTHPSTTWNPFDFLTESFNHILQNGGLLYRGSQERNFQFNLSLNAQLPRYDNIFQFNIPDPQPQDIFNFVQYYQQ